MSFTWLVWAHLQHLALSFHTIAHCKVLTFKKDALNQWCEDISSTSIVVKVLVIGWFKIFDKILYLNF